MTALFLRVTWCFGQLNWCMKVDVPDPIPLDPARDVPMDTLGSTWIVAAGPSAPGQPDYKGRHPSLCPLSVQMDSHLSSLSAG